MAKNKKSAERGRAIMAEAKKIRAANPSKKWTDCVKEAGKKQSGKKSKSNNKAVDIFDRFINWLNS